MFDDSLFDNFEPKGISSREPFEDVDFAAENSSVPSSESKVDTIYNFGGTTARRCFPLNKSGADFPLPLTASFFQIAKQFPFQLDSFQLESIHAIERKESVCI